MPTKPKPLTREEKMQQRFAELDWEQQMQAYHAAERAEQEREHNEFAQRVQARRDAEAAIAKRFAMQRPADRPMSAAEQQQEQEAIEAAIAEAFPPVAIKSFDQIYGEQRAQEVAAAEAAEAARIAALSPRDVVLSALPQAKKEDMWKWEKGHPGQEFH